MRTLNRHVSLLFRMGERYLTGALAGTHVTSGTAPLVLALNSVGPCRLAALAAEVGVDRAYVTRTVRGLEEDGLVIVSHADKGVRSRSVSLTEQGRAVAEQVERAMLDWLDIVSEGVSTDDLATVEAVFDQFYANARRHLVDPDTA